MMASVNLSSILALMVTLEIASSAVAIAVAYIFTSLIGLPVKSLNGVNGRGRSTGLRMAPLSVLNLVNHDALAGSENSPL